MKIFVAALGLMLILEGLPYFAAPRKAREVMAWISTRPAESLRWMGLALLTAGLALLWATRLFI